MISYELAKQLKDAGFPMRAKIIDPSQYPSKTFHVPTLSELIEACGDQSLNLMRSGDKWLAQTYMSKDLIGNELTLNTIEQAIVSVTDCPTPEEAIAMLWLKLNSKA